MCYSDQKCPWSFLSHLTSTKWWAQLPFYVLCSSLWFPASHSFAQIVYWQHVQLYVIRASFMCLERLTFIEIFVLLCKHYLELEVYYYSVSLCTAQVSSWQAFCDFAYFVLLILCVWVFGLHVCLCTMCMTGTCGGQRGQQIPWSWSYRCLGAAMWMLGTKAWSSARAPTALESWNISPAQIVSSWMEH